MIITCFSVTLRRLLVLATGILGWGCLELGAATPAPSITSKLTSSGQVGVAYSYQITANRNPTSFAATGLPTGLSVNPSTGFISGTPAVSGRINVTIAATNSGGTGSEVLVLSLLPARPVITSSSTATAELGVSFLYQITATNSPTGYDASGLPAGLTVSTATGLITGKSTVTGTKSVTLTATNAAGSSTAPLTITTTLAKPVISSPSAASGAVGQPFSYQVTASNNPTSFGASGLPAGLNVSAATGLISGTPSSAGSFNATVSATNAGGTGTSPLTISIGSAAPVITSALSVGAATGVAFSYQVTATGQPNQFAATGLPAGLMVNTSTGLITGTPVVPGTALVNLSATGAGGTGSAVLQIRISATLPFTSDFEVSESYTAGALNGQLGWIASGPVTVSGLDVYSGSAAVRAASGSPAATFGRAFAPGAPGGIAYVDFFARPAAEVGLSFAARYTAEGARFGFSRMGADGALYAFDGDGAGSGAWKASGFVLPLAADFTAPWLRLTARADFSRKKWDLYANAQMVAADLSLLNASSTYLATFDTTGSAAMSTSLDDFYAGAANPLFPDVNNNGIDDAWETAHGLSLASDNRNLSPSGNGVSVVQAYIGKTDPNDFYNGLPPTLTVVSGDLQSAPPGEFNSLPFVVSVRTPSGASDLVNAPVTFSVLQGGGLLGATNSPAGPLFSTLALRTNSAGTAQVYFQQPFVGSVSSRIAVTAGTASMSFSTTSQDGSDTDRDGLSDAWEQQYLATLSFGSADDPGGVGRTLLQSFNQGVSPWSTPIVSAGLRAFYRASLGVTMSGSNSVITWADLSGNSAHLRQLVTTLQPSFVQAVPATNATVEFSGTSLLRAVAADYSDDGGDVTLVAVVRPEQLQADHAVVFGFDGEWFDGPLMGYTGGVAMDRFGLVTSEASGGVTGERSSASLSSESLQLVEYVKAGASFSTYLNGSYQGGETAQTIWNSVARSIVVGGVQDGVHGFRGRVAELRIYNRGLSDLERQQVESEVALRYQLSLGSVADSDGDGLSDAEEAALGTDGRQPDHPDVELQVTLPVERSSIR